MEAEAGMPSFHLGYARLQVSSSGNLVVYMRDTRTSCALTSLRSAYAGQKNASSGILILWIHRDARCSCVQTRTYAHWHLPARFGRVLIPHPPRLNHHLRSHHLKTKKPPVKGGDGGGGGNRTRECRFCKPMPYHLATPP